MSRVAAWRWTVVALAALALLAGSPGPAAGQAPAADRGERPAPEQPGSAADDPIEDLLGWLTGVLGLQLGSAPLEPSTRRAPEPVTPVATVTYEVVDDAGVGPSALARFAERAAATLRDPRGWALDGAIRFTRVDRGADFRLHLADPGQVAAHPGCSAEWSCTVGDDVYINRRNWNRATPTWADVPLEAYRHYVVVHEVGHVIGLPHVECGRAHRTPSGRPAPVMDQQSIDLGACEINTWPLASERRWARRLITRGTPQYARY